MAGFVSPGVYVREIDLSLYIPAISTAIAAMIGTASKGEVNKRLFISSRARLPQVLGFVDPDHPGLIAADYYLRKGRQLWYVRVANRAAPAYRVWKSPSQSSADISDPGKGVLLFYANSPGSWGNNIEIEIEPGSSRGTFRVVVFDPLTAQIAEVYDNLTKDDAFDGNNDAGITFVELAINGPSNLIFVASDFQGDLQDSNGDQYPWRFSQDTNGIPGIQEDELQLFAIDGSLVEVEVVPGIPDQSGIGVPPARRVYWKLDSNGNRIERLNEAQVRTAPPETEPFFDIDGTAYDNGGNPILPEFRRLPLLNGTDGFPVTEADIIGVDLGSFKTGIQLFANSETVDVNIIAAPGWSAPSVITELIGLCERRGDCLALIDPPRNYGPIDVVNWHNGWIKGTQGAGENPDSRTHAPFNSSYGALYWPWVQIPVVGFGNIWTPPSGIMAGVIAFSDFVSYPWFAPAGLTRGRIPEAIITEYSPDLGERDLLYSGGNAINPIVNFLRDGVVVWGQRTLQRKPTALDRVNVRRMLLFARKAIATATRLLVFEQNDEVTWKAFIDLVTPFLESIRNARGLTRFAVKMDEETNPPDQIDQNIMRGEIYIQPTKSAEILIEDFIITRTGAAFNT